MNMETVKSAIRSNKVLNAVISFDTIDSTSKYLMSNKFSTGTIAVASEQTAGRGKHGAKWAAPKGGLWFSFVVNRKVKRPYDFVILSSAAVCEALATLKVKAQIKWPNDILVNGKKICGMLVENDSYNGKVVTGIGINVNNSAPGGAGLNAVSLKNVLKKMVGLEGFFVLVVKKLDKYLSDMSGSRKKYAANWAKRLTDIKGKKIRLYGKTGEFTVDGIGRNGSITVIDVKNKRKQLNGEVFFL
jgi:BirA family biotin operon repressor/biotin-[acetyl-CoA-carboxylase] ligase